MEKIEPSERDWAAAAIVCREAAELPDRDACEHMTPDDMLVTGDELQPMIAAAIAAAREEGRREATQWRPIETAPNSHILLLWVNSGSFNGHYRVMYWCEIERQRYKNMDKTAPTHWLPLPPPPERGDG